MIEAGMQADYDADGKEDGRFEGAEPGRPALLIGSHYDTVRNAGRYDGMYGIVAGIAHALIEFGFDTINVPSAPRYALDAVSACTMASRRGWHGIPHLRAMDILPDEVERLVDQGYVTM